MDAYLEVGPKKVFACAVDWPGWCRSAKTDAGALEALAAYGKRYRAALGGGLGFTAPVGASAFKVVERLKGGSGTDFGIPSAELEADRRAVDDDELRLLVRILEASWATFDKAAEAASGQELSKGPRGGGRELETIIEHVLEAEMAYAKQIGVPTPEAKARGVARTDQMAAVRAVALAALTDRAHSVPPPQNPRRKAAYWSVRYFARRSAWHALDHAWEIEDRVL
jgi:hypothetical protein